MMKESKRTIGFRSWLAMLPAVGTALLPRFTCPCTLPAYAGLISAMGLGFLTQTDYLLPLTVISLLLAVGALGFRANRRRGYGPLLVGTLAAVALLLGKFVIASNPAVYLSTGALVDASLWNSWPTGAKRGVSFAPTETLYQIGSIEEEKRNGY